MLATLGFEGQPAAEVVPMTVQVWLKAICRRRVFEQGPDTPRIREAFAMLAERSKRWPSPSDFIECLPSNVVPMEKPKRLEREEKRQSGLRHLSAIAEKLGIPKPNEERPEPPEAA